LLPKEWDEIGINHLVLTKDDSQWGAFWEAITVEKAGDHFTGERNTLPASD